MFDLMDQMIKLGVWKEGSVITTHPASCQVLYPEIVAYMM